MAAIRGGQLAFSLAQAFSGQIPVPWRGQGMGEILVRLSLIYAIIVG